MIPQEVAIQRGMVFQHNDGYLCEITPAETDHEVAQKVGGLTIVNVTRLEEGSQPDDSFDVEIEEFRRVYTVVKDLPPVRETMPREINLDSKFITRYTVFGMDSPLPLVTRENLEAYAVQFYGQGKQQQGRRVLEDLFEESWHDGVKQILVFQYNRVRGLRADKLLELANDSPQLLDLLHGTFSKDLILALIDELTTVPEAKIHDSQEHARSESN